MSHDEMLNMECEKYECYSVAKQKLKFETREEKNIIFNFWQRASLLLIAERNVPCKIVVGIFMMSQRALILYLFFCP